MAEVKWIKITTDVFDDEKILLIESMPDANAIIVIWFKLLCLAGKQNNSGVFMMNDKIAYTDKMLSTIFRMNEATVQMALKVFEQFGMIEMVDGVITIPNWGKHQNLDQLENKKNYMRNYMSEYREKQKKLTCKTNSKTNSKTNVSEADKEKDKEREEIKKKNKDNKNIFDTLRSDYILHTAVEEKVLEWLNYKNERKEYYVEQGMKTLLRQIENNSLTYGDEALCQVIDDSMSNGYKGIIFDKLKKLCTNKEQPKQQGRLDWIDSL